LSDIVMRCLEKAPADRYARGTALADALLAFLSHGDENSDAYRGAAAARRPATIPPK
jgi:hypothetical protein